MHSIAPKQIKIEQRMRCQQNCWGLNFYTNYFAALINELNCVIMPKEVSFTKFLRSRHRWKKRGFFQIGNIFAGNSSALRKKKQKRKWKKWRKKCGSWQRDLDTKTGITIAKTFKSPGNAGPALASYWYISLCGPIRAILQSSTTINGGLNPQF